MARFKTTEKLKLAGKTTRLVLVVFFCPILMFPLPLLKSAIAKQINSSHVGIAYTPPSPQLGGQTDFFNTQADVCIFGGAAGSGKSRAILLKAIRHINNPDYGAVIFRRTAPEITIEGGLWDDSTKLYSNIPGARSRESKLDWVFSSGASISFGHAQYEKDVENKYPGSQINYIVFDELTKFTPKQFWFLFSRNRSTCGVNPRIDATCNPDADSWVKSLIQWWIDEKTGIAIKERSGHLRYFYRISGQIYWGDTIAELEERFPDMAAIAPPKSFTFIPGSVYENKALLDTNPQYLSNLLALDSVEKARLLDGNWNIRATKDCLFESESILYSLRGKWEQPQRDRIYIAAVDPNFGGSDFFTTHIYDATNSAMRLVAEYHEQNRTVTFSIAQSKILFEMYNPIKIAIETNSGGKIVAENLADYPISEITTNASNKVINTDRVAIFLLRGLLEFPYGWSGIEEFRNFSTKERRAIAGHDDHVMCCAIASTLFEKFRTNGDGMGFA